MTYHHGAGGFFCDGCSLKIGAQPEASLLLADGASRDLCTPCAERIADVIDIQPTAVIFGLDDTDTDDITIPVQLGLVGKRSS